MTLKQATFIQEYTRQGNATEAAMQVYDCKNRKSARVIGSQNLAKLNISDVLEELGLTDKRIGELVIEGLNDSDSVVRYRYLVLAIKLKGLFETDKPETRELNSLNNLFSHLKE